MSTRSQRIASRLLTAAIGSVFLFALVAVPKGRLEPEQSPGYVAPPPGEEPTLGFSWAMSDADLGSVVMPSSAAGWFVGTNGLRYRQVPSFTSDTTLEVLVAAPASGHPFLAERFLIQFPANFLTRPLEDRAVVCAFHSFSVSEKQIFLSTSLPQECANRGWMLIAPYGLKDTHFANVGTQDSLHAILELVYTQIPFNFERIYGVGFSMGGLTALSFGMRAQDPGASRFAAIVAHTPTVDVTAAYNASDAILQTRLSNPAHFGTTPQLSPFAFERVSPAQFLANGLVDPDRAPIDGLNVPIYLFANLADPNTTVLNEVLALRDHLASSGARLTENFVTDPGLGHSWSTLPLTEALDHVARAVLRPVSRRYEVYADREASYSATEVVSKSADVHARYSLERSPSHLPLANSLSIRETAHLDTLRIRLVGQGLDPTLPLLLEVRATDNTSDHLILAGYPSEPTTVRIADGNPHAAAVQLPTHTWDPVENELHLHLPLTRGRARVHIVP